MNAKQTISGDWEMIVNPEITNSTSDKVNSSQKVYYTFSELGEYGDGEYKTIFDGGIEADEYKPSEKTAKAISIWALRISNTKYLFGVYYKNKPQTNPKNISILSHIFSPYVRL